MRAVISLYSENMQAVADLTIPSHVRFAEQHGWHQDAVVVDQENSLWEKLNFISQYLEKDYTSVLWLDADVLITNPKPITWILDENPAADVFLTADVNGLNAGVILIRNTPWSKAYFYACRTHGKTLFGDRPNGEQQALQHFSSAYPYAGIVHYVPQRELNSYHAGAYDYPNCRLASWQQGDFALHLPSLPNEDRILILKQYIK
jgi:hypothetical protein